MAGDFFRSAVSATSSDHCENAALDRNFLAKHYSPMKLDRLRQAIKSAVQVFRANLDSADDEILNRVIDSDLQNLV